MIRRLRRTPGARRSAARGRAGATGRLRRAQRRRGAVEAAIRGPGGRAAVQAGLRVVFGADDGSLADGIIGPVTLSFLGELCAQRAARGGHRARSRAPSIWPAQYAALVAAAAPTGACASPIPRLLAAATPGFSRDVLRLAGSPEIGGGGAGRNRDRDDCAALARPAPGRRRGPARLRAGLAAWSTPIRPRRRRARARAARRALAGRSARSIRRRRAPRRWLATVARLGGIAAAVPGAVGDPRLAASSPPGWPRRPRCGSSRLLGTVPAVVRAPGRVLAEAGPVPPAEVPRWPRLPRARAATYRPGSRSTPPTSRR